MNNFWKKIAVVVILVALVPTGAFAAIAFDSASGAGGTTAGSLTFSHTITGTNMILFVTQVKFGGTNCGDPVTYNGTPMTFIRQSGMPFGIHALYYMINPPTGAHDVVLCRTAGGGTVLSGKAASYSGVDQSSPLGVAGDNTVNPGGSVSTTVSIGTANSWAVVSCGGGQPNISVSITVNRANGNNAAIGDSNAALSTGNYTGECSMSPSDFQAVIVQEFKVAAAAPAGGGFGTLILFGF